MRDSNPRVSIVLACHASAVAAVPIPLHILKYGGRGTCTLDVSFVYLAKVVQSLLCHAPLNSLWNHESGNKVWTRWDLHPGPNRFSCGCPTTVPAFLSRRAAETPASTWRACPSSQLFGNPASRADELSPDADVVNLLGGYLRPLRSAALGGHRVIGVAVYFFRLPLKTYRLCLVAAFTSVDPSNL